MKKILWFLSVVLILLLATGASANTRSDKCNAYSNDLGISAMLDSYSGDICVWAGSINYYTNKDKNAYLAAFRYRKGATTPPKREGIGRGSRAMKRSGKRNRR